MSVLYRYDLETGHRTRSVRLVYVSQFESFHDISAGRIDQWAKEGGMYVAS
jgi:hypothetical protein